MSARLAGDFDPNLIAASKSALLELARCLKHYSKGLILVGGWVPYLLIEGRLRPGNPFTHVGSIDIDFVVDPSEVGEDEYQTIVELIRGVGWKPIEKKRFSFERSVPGADGQARDIQVDFLSTTPEGYGRKHRHRPIQPDLEARTMRGAELALRHRAPRRLSGVLPDGAETSVEFLMLDVVGSLGTKGIALGERFKHKDAYDIVTVLDDFGGGVREVSALVKPFVSEALMAEALNVIEAKFQSPRSEGPVWYAEFLAGDPASRASNTQRAFQLVAQFLSGLT